MRSPERPPTAGLIRRLAETPERFEFMQAVRLLQRHFRDSAGLDSQQAASRIRFGSSLALAFPASEVEALQFETTAQDDGSTREQARIVPSFIGLTGTLGALPRHDTERLIAREALHRDRAARAFLELFSDRATALFYQAWLKYRLPFQYEDDRRERVLPMLMSLIGLGAGALRGHGDEDGAGDGGGDRDDARVLDESLACYAGLLRTAARPAAVIEAMLADYFGAPVRLTQFIGRWFEVPVAQCTTLGGRTAALGTGALCGQRVWQRENRLRLSIGPLTRAGFDALLPRGRGAAALARLLGLLTGSQFEYELQLILRRDEVPVARLGAAIPLRLGWDSWLLSAAPDADLADAGYELQPRLD